MLLYLYERRLRCWHVICYGTLLTVSILNASSTFISWKVYSVNWTSSKSFDAKIFLFVLIYLDSRKNMCLHTCRYISFFLIGYMVKLLEKESQLKIMNKWQILFLSIAQIALDMKPTTVPALYIGKFSSTLAKVWIFVEWKVLLKIKTQNQKKLWLKLKFVQYLKQQVDNNCKMKCC